MGRIADITQYTKEENEFWDKLCACQGLKFTTISGLDFSFSVKGNKLFFTRKNKSITRATVMQTYRTAKKLINSGTVIKGPQKLGVFGASYLLPIFRLLELV